MHVTLQDSGISLDWNNVEIQRVCMYSEAQKAYAGYCEHSISESDGTILICEYPAEQQHYVGDYRLIMQVKYGDNVSTYDALAFTLVALTSEVTGIVEPGTPVEVGISISTLPSSTVAEIIQACIDATAASVEQTAEAAEAEAERKQAEAARVLAEEARERQAAADHGIAANDHTLAESDHRTAAADHQTAGSDHTLAESDHRTAAADHETAADDHAAAVQLNAGLFGIIYEDGYLIVVHNAEAGTLVSAEMDSHGMITFKFNV